MCRHETNLFPILRHDKKSLEALGGYEEEKVTCPICCSQSRLSFSATAGDDDDYHVPPFDDDEYAAEMNGERRDG